MGEGEQGCRLGAPFFRHVAGPLFETLALIFALFCLSWWTTLEPQALEKVACFSK